MKGDYIWDKCKMNVGLCRIETFISILITWTSLLALLSVPMESFRLNWTDNHKSLLMNHLLTESCESESTLCIVAPPPRGWYSISVVSRHCCRRTPRTQVSVWGNNAEAGPARACLLVLIWLSMTHRHQSPGHRSPQFPGCARPRSQHGRRPPVSALHVWSTTLIDSSNNRLREGLL